MAEIWGPGGIPTSDLVHQKLINIITTQLKKILPKTVVRYLSRQAAMVSRNTQLLPILHILAFIILKESTGTNFKFKIKMVESSPKWQKNLWEKEKC